MISNENKQIGNKTELVFMDILFGLGWLPVFIPPSTTGGQPIDVVAFKNGVPLFCDVKHIMGDSFSFGSVRENQKTSLSLFIKRNPECDNLKVGFAIFSDLTNQFYFLHAKKFFELYQNNIKSVKIEKLPLFF